MIPMWLLAGPALASVVYPGDLAEAAGSDCVPPCTVCHQTLSGGAGTVVTPFGEAMMAAGLTGGSNADALAAAVAALEADASDSDGDGEADVEELAVGQDPSGGEPFCDVLVPEYGCFNQGQAPAGALAVALAGLLAAGRRRSRPSVGPAPG